MSKGGDQVLLWPSGRPSVAAFRPAEGQIITITADDDKGTILANFDHKGVGGVQYENGKPWLVSTLEGWTVSDKLGNIIERGIYPRKFPPLECNVNLALTVIFKDRLDIVAKYVCEETRKEWQCGEMLRRTESYTTKAVGSKNGKLELDVASIRQRQKDVGSLYVPVGPHANRTDRAGLGRLKASLSQLPPEGALANTIKGLQESDARISSINNLPVALYGTSRMGSTANLPGASGNLGSTQGGMDSTQSSLSSSYMASILPDYGAPPLSDTQKRLSRKPKRMDAYKSRRTKLVLLRGLDIDATLFGEGVERDLLIAVVVLATWNPVCGKLETQLEYANCELQEEAGQIKVFKLDASDGNMLQTKYDFRTSPMFLFFYNKKLVGATSSTLSASQFKQLPGSSLAATGSRPMNTPLTRLAASWQLLDSHRDLVL
eukprot:gene25035-10682_t